MKVEEAFGEAGDVGWREREVEIDVQEELQLQPVELR